MQAGHLTIRNASPELVKRLKLQAQAAGMSVNATVLRILEQALGVDERRRHLEERYGTWSAQDFEEFDTALHAQRQVDDKIWR